MRIARKILLLTVMAFAAMALAATAASANPVTVIDEHSAVGAECDPCDIHVVGEAVITALPSGVPVSSCEDEFEGEINADGSGTIEWIGAPHGAAPGCNVVNCTNAATGPDPYSEWHWPISNMEETAGSVSAMVRFCLRAGAGELHCDAPVDIADAGGHHYVFSTHVLCGAGTREVEGEWEVESELHDEIEIVH